MKTPALLLLATAAFLQAETLTTLDGITYTGVSVTKTTPAAISISHSSGIARIPLANLPSEIQKKYGYDPARAAAFAAEEIARHEEIKKQAEARQQQLEQTAAAEAQAREQAQAARQEAAKQAQKNRLAEGTTPISMVVSDPVPDKPFKVKAFVNVDSYYGVGGYSDAQGSHYVFSVAGGRESGFQVARGFFTREKGKVLREAIARNGREVIAIVSGVYLRHRYGNSHEFEILDYKIIE
jgi:regulator of protease activity HflC (stomatin/prohibitin superfamily)